MIKHIIPFTVRCFLGIANAQIQPLPFLISGVLKRGAGQAVHQGLDFDPLSDKADNKKLRAKLAALGWHEHLATDRECVAYMAALGAVK